MPRGSRVRRPLRECFRPHSPAHEPAPSPGAQELYPLGSGVLGGPGWHWPHRGDTALLGRWTRAAPHKGCLVGAKLFLFFWCKAVSAQPLGHSGDSRLPAAPRSPVALAMAEGQHGQGLRTRVSPDLGPCERARGITGEGLLSLPASRTSGRLRPSPHRVRCTELRTPSHTWPPAFSHTSHSRRATGVGLGVRRAERRPRVCDPSSPSPTGNAAVRLVVTEHGEGTATLPRAVVQATGPKESTPNPTGYTVATRPCPPPTLGPSSALPVGEGPPGPPFCHVVWSSPCSTQR